MWRISGLSQGNNCIDNYGCTSHFCSSWLFWCQDTLSRVGFIYNLDNLFTIWSSKFTFSAQSNYNSSSNSKSNDHFIQWHIGSKNKDGLSIELEDRLKRIAVNQCCLLVYTSGTTGQPKGAMMSHDNLTWTARISNEFLSANSKDIFLSYLPLSHSAAQMIDVWMPIAGKISFFWYCVTKGFNVLFSNYCRVK